MSDQTYCGGKEGGRPLVWLGAEVRSPPLSRAARVEAGVLLRRLQEGEVPGMPHSRPMPAIGRRCHELRIVDRTLSWRIVVRLDADAVVVLAVFAKSRRETPKQVIDRCRARLADYDRIR